jgi:type II secretory pathway predicted ATPase ExeA
MKPPGSYESFFGLVERPFSLTPDPKYFFESRSHGSAREVLGEGLRRRERFLLVTGDLGVGKTALCRTLIPELRERVPVSFIANPLLTPSGLFRLLLEDFGALSARAPAAEHSSGATPHELRDLLVEFLNRSRSMGRGAVVVIDEAQTLPLSVVEHLLLLGALHHQGEQPLQLVLVGQPLLAEPGAIGVRALNAHVSTRARLTPLGRDECAAYVAHRLAVAGAERNSLFTSSAIDMLYALSGGVPRLVNLLAERALQEAATERTHKVGPAMIDAAASALELVRGTTRRFRWFTRRVS